MGSDLNEKSELALSGEVAGEVAEDVERSAETVEQVTGGAVREYTRVVTIDILQGRAGAHIKA